MRCQVWNNYCSKCICLWRERKFQARMKGMFRVECVFRYFGLGSRWWRFSIPLFLSKSLLPNLFVVNRLDVVPEFQFLLIQVSNAIVVNVLSPANIWIHRVSVITNWMWIYPWLFWILTWSFLVTSMPVTVIIEATSLWQNRMIEIKLDSWRIWMCEWTNYR